MSLPNGSASGNERTIACPASLALPRVNSSTKWSERGHGIHGFIRATLAGADAETAIGSVDEEHRATCRLIDWGALCGDLDQVRTEVAYAVDVRARTARFLGINVARDYEAAALAAGAPLGEWEVPGSLDLEGVRLGDSREVVVDVKSGFQDVTDPEENGQGLFFGAAKMLTKGVDEVDFRIAKLKPNGRIFPMRATYTRWDVDAYLDTLERALVRSKDARRVYLSRGVPEVTEGPWCRYCPAANACPAKTNLARNMLSTVTAIDEAIAAMSKEDAGRAYETAHDRVAPVLERILEALKDRARLEPLPLPDGRILREAPYEKDQQVFSEAVALARELGATEEQVQERCFRPTTIRPVRACKPEAAKRAKRAARATP